MIPEENVRRRLWRKAAKFGILHHGRDFLIPLQHAECMVRGLAEEGFVVFSCSQWGAASHAPGELVEFSGTFIATGEDCQTPPTADQAAQMSIAFLGTVAEDVTHVLLCVREGQWLDDWFRQWLEP